jgi:hypothetical protein
MWFTDDEEVHGAKQEQALRTLMSLRKLRIHPSRSMLLFPYSPQISIVSYRSSSLTLLLYPSSSVDLEQATLGISSRVEISKVSALDLNKRVSNDDWLGNLLPCLDRVVL